MKYLFLLLLSAPAIYCYGQGTADTLQSYNKAMAFYKNAQYDSAYQYFNESFQKGSRQAELYLGMMLRNGLGVRKDAPRALQIMRKFALSNKHAMFYTGEMYYFGEGTAVNKDSARVYFELVNLYGGNPKAWAYIAIDYLGNDNEEALWRLRKSADKGVDYAKFLLGKIFYYGSYGIEKDFDEALKWLVPVSKLSSYAKESNRILGWIYYGRTNYVSSFQHFLTAAENGDRDSQYLVSVLYSEGKGTQQNTVKAFGWYRKAADAGHAMAQNNLGNCFEKGLGTEKDLVAARQWYLKAADQNVPQAQYNLARIYGMGLGIEKDETKSRHYLQKAADQGYTDAINTLNQLNKQ